MRFHVKYNNSKIFVGFQAKSYRFVFYTHGKIFTVEDWKKFVETFDLKIYDEEGNWLTWGEFMAFVDHLQHNSNASWVNGYMFVPVKGDRYFKSAAGYNFSNNGAGKNGSRL